MWENYNYPIWYCSSIGIKCTFFKKELSTEQPVSQRSNQKRNKNTLRQMKIEHTQVYGM